MKRNLKTTMTMVLLALMLGSFPMMAWAAEEPKPAEQPKAAQQKQEEDKVTGEVSRKYFKRLYLERSGNDPAHSL